MNSKNPRPSLVFNTLHQVMGDLYNKDKSAALEKLYWASFEDIKNELIDRDELESLWISNPYDDDNKTT